MRKFPQTRSRSGQERKMLYTVTSTCLLNLFVCSFVCVLSGWNEKQHSSENRFVFRVYVCLYLRLASVTPSFKEFYGSKQIPYSRLILSLKLYHYDTIEVIRVSVLADLSERLNVVHTGRYRIALDKVRWKTATPRTFLQESINQSNDASNWNRSN